MSCKTTDSGRKVAERRCNVVAVVRPAIEQNVLQEY
jgi:hypothetical protein